MSSLPSATDLPPPAPGLAEELAVTWRALPEKVLFLTLLGAWILLFHALGNSTFGYVDSPSLFGWLNYSYAQSKDDELGRYIPFLVLGLCWWKRDELMAVPKAPWIGGLALLALALLLHVAGFAIQQTRLSVIGFYVGIYGLVGAFWGYAFLKAIFFPYFLFGFCLPVGTLADTLTLPLRMLATTLTTLISKYILGVKLIQEGTRIFDADHKFTYEVAAACGGLRSLTATLALASIYAFINLERPWKRLTVIASAFPFAVAGNVLRLILIIIAAEGFGQKAGNWVHDNSVLSLVPYIPAFLGLGALGKWLREPGPITPSPNAPEPETKDTSGVPPTPPTP